ncbi:MAG: hypothetical protein WCF44_03360 [Candidatus Methylophosphatis roskildensis]
MSLVIPSQHKARQARTSEEHAWDTLYRTKHDPTAATEVVEYLDSEPEVRKSHLGLYLCCRQTVRAHEARRVRTQRIAAFLQLALHLVLVVPLRVVMRALRGSGDVAVELMPQVQATRTVVAAKSEPAVKRLRKVVKSGNFAQAKATVPDLAGAPSVAVGAAPATTPAAAPDGKGAEAFSTIR